MSIPASKLYNEALREPGMLAAHHPAGFIESCAAGEAIPFGCAVARDAQGKLVLPSSGTAQAAGVAAFSYEASRLDEDSYAKDDAAGVIETGIAVVKVSEAVAAGDDVRVRLEGPNKGFFCKTAEAGKTARISGCEWRGAYEDGKAELYVKGPFSLSGDN